MTVSTTSLYSYIKGTYNAAQNLGCQERLHVLGREEQRRPGNDENQTTNHCPSVSDALRHPAVEQQTDQLSNVGALVMLTQKNMNSGVGLTLLRPDCHGAVTCQSPLGSISPYLRLN